MQTALKLRPRFARVCDLGCGSGALLLWTLQCAPECDEGFAVDVCEEAIAVSRRNAERNGMLHKVKFLKMDWRKSCPVNPFDLVLWNPPYVKSADCCGIEDPILALDGGLDGLTFYRSPPWHWVKSGGFMVTEIGHGMAEDVIALLRTEGNLLEVAKDLQGRF